MEPLYTSLVSRKVTKLINYQTTGFLRKMTQKLQCGIGLNQAGNWIQAKIQENPLKTTMLENCKKLKRE